jgi:Tfp pilus assembly protein PilF
MSPTQTIQIEMIQADMQQALELLAVGQYDLALHHISEALRKAQDMKETCPVEPPKPKQDFLDV